MRPTEVPRAAFTTTRRAWSCDCNCASVKHLFVTLGLKTCATEYSLAGIAASASIRSRDGII
jgi:hypothetical protein